MDKINTNANQNKSCQNRELIIGKILLPNLVFLICFGTNLKAFANPQIEPLIPLPESDPQATKVESEKSLSSWEWTTQQEIEFSNPSLPNTSNELLFNNQNSEFQGIFHPKVINNNQDTSFSQEKIDLDSDNIAQSYQQSEQIEYTLTPLQLHPFEPLNLETANVLPKGSIQINYGFHAFNKGDEGQGIGLQVYHLSVDGGVTDNLQLGLAFMLFDDPLNRRINGKLTDLNFISYAPNFRYQFIQKPSYSLAVTGSVELLKISSENRLFNSSDNFKTGYSVGGTLQLPFTYNISENAQWHFVGGLAVFPDTINDGGDFYGTFFNIGTGVSLKFNERFGFFADLNVPLGPGGNTVNKNGKVNKNVVWSAGVNYLHSPAVGIDISATNTLGATPATQLLTFIPDGGDVAVGLNVRYTPNLGNKYQANFNDQPLSPLSPRDKQFLINGVSLTTAETLRQGMLSLDAGTGAGATFQIAYGISDDAQFEFIGQQLGDNNTKIGNSFKMGAATKLRFLNQAEGDPFSFSIRGGFEDAITLEDGVGIFTAEASFLYQLNPQVAFMFNPKASFFGSTDIVGTGFGINYQPFSGFQLIGEVTPILTGEPLVWAAGARYLHPEVNLGLGVYGSNAAGTHDAGSLIRQSNQNVSVGFNVFWLWGD